MKLEWGLKGRDQEGRGAVGQKVPKMKQAKVMMIRSSETVKSTLNQKTR